MCLVSEDTEQDGPSNVSLTSQPKWHALMCVCVCVCSAARRACTVFEQLGGRAEHVGTGRSQAGGTSPGSPGGGGTLIAALVSDTLNPPPALPLGMAVQALGLCGNSVGVGRRSRKVRLPPATLKSFSVFGQP